MLSFHAWIRVRGQECSTLVHHALPGQVVKARNLPAPKNGMCNPYVRMLWGVREDGTIINTTKTHQVPRYAEAWLTAMQPCTVGWSCLRPLWQVS